ncbi:MAG: hypothetical protein KUG81_04575, partial [Gammaproteobacteria bacterium]|nr:hypothetical protein [Gammaproteobacteria bacterium]
MKDINRHNAMSFIVALSRGMQNVRKGKKDYSCLTKHKRKEWDFVASYPNYIDAIDRILVQEEIDKEDLIMDLGAGFSPILMYLHLLSYRNLIGYDNEPDYVKNLNLYIPAITTRQANLRRLTPAQTIEISNAKVVYTYMPLAQHSTFNSYLEKIWKLLPSGAILISFYAMGWFRDQHEDCLIKVKD